MVRSHILGDGHQFIHTCTDLCTFNRSKKTSRCEMDDHQTSIKSININIKYTSLYIHNPSMFHLSYRLPAKRPSCCSPPPPRSAWPWPAAAPWVAPAAARHGGAVRSAPCGAPSAEAKGARERRRERRRRRPGSGAGEVVNNGNNGRWSNSQCDTVSNIIWKIMKNGRTSPGHRVINLNKYIVEGTSCSFLYHLMQLRSPIHCNLFQNVSLETHNVSSLFIDWTHAIKSHAKHVCGAFFEATLLMTDHWMPRGNISAI